MGVCIGKRLPVPLWGQLPGEGALGWLVQGRWPSHILPTSLLAFRQFSLVCHFLLEVPGIDSLFLFFPHVAGSYSCYLFDINSYGLEAGLAESWKNKCFRK